MGGGGYLLLDTRHLLEKGPFITRHHFYVDDGVFIRYKAFIREGPIYHKTSFLGGGGGIY